MKRHLKSTSDSHAIQLRKNLHVPRDTHPHSISLAFRSEGFYPAGLYTEIGIFVGSAQPLEKKDPPAFVDIF